MLVERQPIQAQVLKETTVLTQHLAPSLALAVAAVAQVLRQQQPEKTVVLAAVAASEEQPLAVLEIHHQHRHHKATTAEVHLAVRLAVKMAVVVVAAHLLSALILEATTLMALMEAQAQPRLLVALP